MTFLACAPKAPPPSARPSWMGEPDPGCPTETTDPPVCADPARGRSPEKPFEWGLAASGNQLWYDRLACADGTIAGVQRVGNIGSAPAPSTSPTSGVPPYGGKDVLDAWDVFCRGQEPLHVYTNLYRCGDVCLPPELRVLPAAVLDGVVAAGKALDAGDKAAAVAHARGVTEAAPSFELAWVMRASVAEQAGDLEDALAAWDGALRVSDDPLTRSHRAEVLAKLGRAEEARGEADALLEKFGETSLRPRLVCVQAMTEADAARKEALAEEACGLGYTACCKREP